MGRVDVVSFLLDQTWAATGQRQGAHPGFWPGRLAGGGAISDHLGWLWARPAGVLEEWLRAGPGAGQGLGQARCGWVRPGSGGGGKGCKAIRSRTLFRVLRKPSSSGPVR